MFGCVDLRQPEQTLPEAGAYVFMGSPLAAYDPHLGCPRRWPRRFAALDSGTPTLGVCFGHQLFVGRAARGAQRAGRGETVTVELGADAAPGTAAVPFGGAAGERQPRRHRRGAADARPAVLGTSDRDRHQVLRWGERAWSVQFHPEMRARGRALGALAHAASAGGGEDPDAVLAALDDGIDGRRLLHRFLHLAGIPGARGRLSRFNWPDPCNGARQAGNRRERALPP
ncbi:MAG: hypothetical protein R3F62_31185 [Planctomycetota bacterium]